jgi:4-amino-4-deoxy-L-arabinose transferase-like glycosyltransferase
MIKNMDAAEAWAIQHRYLFLSLVGLVIYVAFIGLRDVWYPDEPDIAEVALAMFNSGDWIAPRRMGTVWVDYPPMIYWVATISAHLLGGMTAFAVRLPNALAAIGIVLMVCGAATQWFNARTGFWSGFALLTCLMFTWQANGYRPDILFTLGIAAGLLLYAQGATGENRRWLKIAAFACLGFAMLSKGILGLLLPGLVLVLWHGARREWAQIVQLVPLSLVSLAVFLPWSVGTAQAMGWENLLQEFYEQNFGRFASGSRGHGKPFWYYFKMFWVDFWPWAFLFPAALTSMVRTGLWRDSRVQLILWWFGAFLIFLSVAETKRELYLLPAYPAIALILGHWLAKVGLTDSDTPAGAAAPREWTAQISTTFVAILFGIVGVGVILASSVLFDTIVAARQLENLHLEVAGALRLPLALLGVVLIAAAAWTGVAAIRHEVRAALLRTGLSQIAIWVVVLAFVAPAFQPAKTYGPQGRWVKQQIGPEQTHIGMVYPALGSHKRGAWAFEMGGTMVELLESPAQVEEFFTAYPNSVVLIEEDSIADIFAGNESDWQARTLRTMPVSRTSYTAVRGPTGKTRSASPADR